MKLIRKINLNFFIASLIILTLMGLSLALILNIIVDEQIEEKLVHSYHRIKSTLKADTTLSSLPPYFEISIINNHPDTLYFGQIILNNKEEEDSEIFKQLTAFVNIDDKTYRIVVRESKLETDDLYETIITIVLITIFFMLIVMYFINRKISQTIWKDFYDKLNRVKSFSLQKLQAIELKESDITEFNELNDVLFNLTSKVISDYKNLKQFSEDASHELQTPLAIIRSNLESLINSNELQDSHIKKIQIIYNTTNRLIRLNKDLLLLTKVENDQFNIKEKINLNQFIINKIDDWQEIINLKHIEITKQFQHIMEFEINPSLAEILISNLLSNAINHNIEEGKIEIRITGNTIDF